jgi:hypothetical protein
MTILTGIFVSTVVLFCTGAIVGYSLLFVRSAEAPPKTETTIQVVMQQNQNPGKTAATSPDVATEEKAILPAEQESSDQQQ